MIKLFKNNPIVSALLLAVLFLLMHFSLNGFAEYNQDLYIHFAFCLVNGFFLHQVCRSIEIIEKKTTLPFLLFGIFCLQLFPIFAIKHHLLCSFLIAILYWVKYYNSRNKENRILLMFAAAIIAILQIVNPSVVLLIPLILITVFSFDRISVNGLLAFLMYYLLTLSLVMAAFYLTDNQDHLNSLIPSFDFSFGAKNILVSWKYLIFWLPILFFSILSFLLSSKFMFRSRTRRLRDFRMFIFIIIYVLGLCIFLGESSLGMVYLIALPSALLICHLLVHAKGRFRFPIILGIIVISFVLSLYEYDAIFDFVQTLI